MRKRIIISIFVIAAVGVLLGFSWATRRPLGPSPDVSPYPSSDNLAPLPSSFGQYFNIFFLGRTGDGSRIRSNSPLVRTTKFLAGEHVGLRVQTTPGVTEQLTLELRFLTNDTREETSSFRKYRQRFKIKPGMRSYCCVSIPEEVGSFSLAILVNGAYVGILSDMMIKPPREIQQGGFWSF